MSEGKPAPQLALVERTAAAAEQINRLAGGDEIADPGRDYDHTVNTAGFGDERLEITASKIAEYPDAPRCGRERRADGAARAAHPRRCWA